MKKGIQYSHYCGTELQELSSFIWLAQDDINANNLNSALEQLKAAQLQVTKLTAKIQELDRLNEMAY